MKTEAAVVGGPGEEWQIVELDLDAPRTGEVLLRMVAAGLCHTDDHIRQGDLAPRFPVVGGHEGAGVVEEVGDGVTRLKPGDHVVCSFLPVCGHCRFCAMGKSNLCDMGAGIMEGALADGTFRFHRGAQDYGSFAMLGTFAQWSTVSEASCVKVDDDVSLETAVLLGCGVVTGWGSSVYAAEAKPGDTVVVYGVGGIGVNAVQGAVHAGATNVVAVDPLGNKLAKSQEFGATHVASNPDEAQQIVLDITRGVGADAAVITVGVADEAVITNGFNIIRKGGTVVVTAVASPMTNTIQLPGTMLTLSEKRLQGSLFGSGNPFSDIPMLLQMYRSGQLKLDELITSRYKLSEVNQGYRDLHDGKNIRGIIVHEH